MRYVSREPSNSNEYLYMVTYCSSVWSLPLAIYCWADQNILWQCIYVVENPHQAHYDPCSYWRWLWTVGSATHISPMFSEHCSFTKHKPPAHEMKKIAHGKRAKSEDLLLSQCQSMAWRPLIMQGSERWNKKWARGGQQGHRGSRCRAEEG